MKQYFDVEQTAYGYTLKNGIDTYVLNKSKIYQNDYQFYLKQVEPNPKFITGLFRKKNKFFGSTIDKKRVQITLFEKSALITIE